MAVAARRSHPRRTGAVADGGRRQAVLAAPHPPAAAPRPRPRYPAILATLVVGGFGPFAADTTALRIAMSITGAVVLAAALYARGHNYKPAPAPQPWYGPETMKKHLARAGVLKEPAWLPYPPRLVRDNQYGSTVDVLLPGGITAAQVIARHGPLAASLGVPLARLTIKAPPEAPANLARLFLRAPRNPAAPVVDGSGETSPIVDFPTFYWGNPLGIPIGRDGEGEVVHYRVRGLHALWCGPPDSGKAAASALSWRPRPSTAT